MEMPKPTEQHRKLQALVGKWSGEEKFHPMPWDPAGRTTTSKTAARMDLDDFWVISDHVQQCGGKVGYCGHGVFGFDTSKKCYTMHWFDVMGSDPGAPATGTWEGNVLRFQHQHPMGHGRYTYEFKEPNLYTFKMEQSQDGKNWMPFMDGVYKRMS